MVQAAHAKMHRARGPQFPLRIIISIALEQRVEPSYHGSFTRSYRPITSWREDPTVFKIAHVPRAVRRIKK